MSHRQSNITIRRQDMESLRGLNWLNDEIMNVYVNLLQVRDLRCNPMVARRLLLHIVCRLRGTPTTALDRKRWFCAAHGPRYSPSGI